MSKKLAIKISSKVTIITLLGLLTLSPLSTLAVVTLDYDNPNKSGSNPYKFNSSNALDSNLLMSVVGCTGIVDKVSRSMMDFVQKETEDIFKKEAEEEIAGELGGGAVETTSKTQEAKIAETNAIATANKKREECFNGIAFTLAKNQLTSMTKYTMNWIGTGFSGDPMYVRDTNTFMAGIAEDVILKELDSLDNESAYPYSLDFKRSYIKKYIGTEANFYDTMKSSMSNYLKPGKTIEDFSTDFSAGGWNAYLGMMLNPQNNPLGNTMIMSQEIADRQTNEITNIKEELAQSGGIFNQKKCVTYAATTEEQAREAWEELVWEEKDYPMYDGNDEVIETSWEEYVALNHPAGFIQEGEEPDCIKWENVTPGVVIKDKISSTLNSPERQLELADTINEVLNMLFTNLITKFQNQGLTSLASNITDFGNTNIAGFGNNTLGEINIYSSTTQGYNSNSFDLIKDLGNTYNYDKLVDGGNWDAKNNSVNGDPTLGLYKDIGIKNTYYTVTTAGKTKLFDGNTSWAVGDRALFNGSQWQKWQAGSKNPIKERGVIQIQQDYIVAAKEALLSIPPIMPALGELDYCIPGPNQNWAINSTETREAYFDYVDGYSFKDVASKTLKVISGIKNIVDSFTLFDEIAKMFGISSDDTIIVIDPPKKDGLLYTTYKDTFINYNSSNIWSAVQSNPLFYVNGKSTFMESMKSDDVYISRIENKISNTKLAVSKMYKEYSDKIMNRYGYTSLMQDKYIELENREEENTSYLPMARDGLKITKNIVSYDEATKDANKYYKEAIIEANLNISKLEEIRKQVNAIVKEAQDRRNNKLLEDGVTIPDNCLEEEEIYYIEESELNYNSEIERCNDEVDNDEDGYIDNNDIDCNGYMNTEGDTYNYDETYEDQTYWDENYEN